MAKRALALIVLVLSMLIVGCANKCPAGEHFMVDSNQCEKN